MANVLRISQARRQEAAQHNCNQIFGMLVRRRTPVIVLRTQSQEAAGKPGLLFVPAPENISASPFSFLVLYPGSVPPSKVLGPGHRAISHPPAPRFKH